MKKSKVPIKKSIKPVAYVESSKSLTLTTKPRVINLCNVYNVSTETMIIFLNEKGYININKNTLLAKEITDLIDEYFGIFKESKDKIRGKTSVNLIAVSNNTTVKKSELNKHYSEKQNESQNTHVKHKFLYLENNAFATKKQDVIYKKLPAIQSYFSDKEAINICSKMSSSFTRKLCNELPIVKNKAMVIYQLHAIANKALEIYGGKILTFIYHLRNLQFKNKTASEIKHYSKVIPDFPLISLVSDNFSFKVSFFLKKSKKNNFKPDIRVFESKHQKQIGFIDEEGYILANIDRVKPQLDLFYEASKNNSYKIFSGVESGNCEFCDKPLTHPTSLRIGIGPICAKNNRVDPSIYRYT